MDEQTKTYGLEIGRRETGIEGILEDLKINGISILKTFISEAQASEYCLATEEVYKNQVHSFGLENLEKIKELDVVRMPLAYNHKFVSLVNADVILDVVRRYIGNEFHLHLQNAVINRKQNEHHQSSWHRDLPYQNWVCSTPLAINAFVCFSPFNSESGGTRFIKGSHRLDSAPSQEFLEEHSYTPIAVPGDLIFFDSMILHRAGNNISTFDRYGINQMFTRPFISQQICLPKLLNGFGTDDAVLHQILGYKYAQASSVDDYRQFRLNKL